MLLSKARENIYDVIVIGGGLIGSAVFREASERGLKLLGIEQYTAGHTLGASHGSRIMRFATGEGAQYVPIVLASYDIMKKIEKETGKTLFKKTGGLMMEDSDGEPSDFFKNTLSTAKEFNIRHKIFNADDIQKQFPQFKVANNTIAYYEYDAGILDAEACVKAQWDLAKKQGADLRENEKVIHYEVLLNGNVLVKTNRGEYKAKKLVIAAGTWVKDLLEQKYASSIQIVRESMHWYAPENSEEFKNATEHFRSSPIFIWSKKSSEHILSPELLYGFPLDKHGGIKVGSEINDQVVSSPDSMDRKITATEEQRMLDSSIKPYFRGLANKAIQSAACAFVTTPDFNIIIDHHPEHAAVILVSDGAGIAAKHALGLAAIVCQLLEGKMPEVELNGQKCPVDISNFSLSRLRNLTPRSKL